MPSKTIVPRQVAVCAIEAEHTCFSRFPVWLDLANVLDASNTDAIAHLPARGGPYHTLSIAVCDFDMSQIPSGRAVEGFEVIVRARAKTADAIYVASVRLARRKVQTPERWADKGRPAARLSTSMSNVTFGSSDDHWRTDSQIPSTTVLMNNNQGFGSHFGVVVRFAQYLPVRERIQLRGIAVNVHYT